MDEKYDVIDELLDFGNINPTTEEIIKQLLEDLVGHVEKPYMISSDEEIDMDDIPGGYDLDLTS